MNLGKYKRIVFSLAAGGLLLVGLFLLLNGTSQVARAAPGDMFVTLSGGGDCSQGNPCDLPTALGMASDGDTIHIAEGVYTGSGGAVVTVTRSITLHGGWDGTTATPPVRDPEAYPTTLDGENARRGVYITGTIAPVLDGLVVANGNATGLGGYSTYDAGGGIYVYEAGAVISNCTIIGNAVPNGTGGGILFIYSNARLENSLIVSNTARWGGGVRTISISPVIRHNRFLSNTSLYGGGIYLMWSDATVEDNVFRGNEATNGGAIYMSGAPSAIVGNLIEGNRGSYGAGIRINIGDPAVISGNVILSNTATVDGGGISITYNDTKLRNNVIAHNRANTNGAGVYIKQASLLLWHNTLAQNTGGSGSGIFVGVNASVNLTNTILVSHTVGITVTAGSTATLAGTLWGSGPWANGTDWGGDGMILTGTVNIWGDPAFVDPDGGDYHISAGSAAIDAGVNAGVTDDIDGDTRPQGGGYDIGADEFIRRIYLPLVVKNHP